VLRLDSVEGPATPSSATTTPCRRGPARTTLYTRRVATRWTCHPGAPAGKAHDVVKTCSTRCGMGDVHFCHGSPLNIGGLRLHLRRSDQRLACMEILVTSWPTDVHRALATLCKLVFAECVAGRRSYELVSDRFELRDGALHRQRRLRGSAARLRSARQITILRHQRRSVSSSSASYDIKSSAKRLQHGSRAINASRHRLFHRFIFRGGF